jgi:CIC family chloride channel protein
MQTDVVTIPAQTPAREVLRNYFLAPRGQAHQAYPVVSPEGKLLGVITRRNLLEDWVSVALAKGDAEALADDFLIAYDLIHRNPITVFPWESCRTAAERMAAFSVGRLPVVSPDDPTRVVGLITRSDLLKPRVRIVEEEGKRERFIKLGR